MIKRQNGKHGNFSLIAGTVLVMFILSVFILSFKCLPYEPNEMNISERFIKPDFGSEHILGTDNFGRDILSRIMVGSRTVLMVGLGSVSIGAVIGISLGALAAIFKKGVGTVIMRIMDGLMAFPGILLAMMLVTVLGGGVEGSVISIGIFIIPTFSRLVYSMVLEVEGLLYIKAAKSYGCTLLKMFFRHYMPAMLPRLITQFSSLVGTAIMIETSLSFLGLGIQPPNASWGLMLSESRQFFLQYPYLAVPPGIAIIITVLGFNLIGDGLNDFLIGRGEEK